jgi:hypothetical protein
VQDVQVVTIEPATLGGLPAFRVRLTYRVPPELGGAMYEEVTLGAVRPDGLLLARYTAPQLHYFEKSLPMFEQMIGTLQLLPAGK